MLNIHLPHSITMNNKYFARLETYKHTEKTHTRSQTLTFQKRCAIEVTHI